MVRFIREIIDFSRYIWRDTLAMHIPGRDNEAVTVERINMIDGYVRGIRKDLLSR